jgi:polyisoprenoid-binding protein YceI
MNTKFFIAPFLAAATTVGVIAFHPGQAFSEPRLTQSAPLNAAGSYDIDPMHTSVGFEVGHMGLSRIQGRFNNVSGKVEVDPQNLNKSSVQVTIKVDSVDTAVAPRDAHLRTADFFEVEKYPVITFKSTKIRKSNTGYIADGILTIKDVSKPVSIRFKAYGPIGQPKGGARAGIVAEPLVINRLDYGVGAGDKLPNGDYAISNAITIRLSAEAIQSEK